MGLSKLGLLGGFYLSCAFSVLHLAASQDSAECSESSDAEFDYQVEASDNFNIYWAVNEGNDSISFKVEYGGQGYVAVGFSVNEQMTNSDAVIGLPDSNSVLEYDLTGYELDDVNEALSKELTEVDITQTSTDTTMTFTRPLTPEGDKTVLSAEEGDETILLWAYGADSILARHEDKGSITLVDLLCSESTATDDEDDSDSDDGVIAAGENCASSDPAYEFEVSPADGYSLFWSVVEDTEVSVKVVYEGEGWVAVGFSDDELMPGSDAVIGLPDEETALEYDMPEYSTPQEAEEQELSNSTVMQSGGVTTLTFIRPLEPTGDGKQSLTISGSTQWLYAWGNSNAFTEHVEEGAFSLSLDSCNFRLIEELDEEYAHGWLMALAWGLFMPIGIISARFSPNFATIGFPVHRALQSVGATLALAGFFVAISFTQDSGKSHFDNSHAKTGLVLTIFVAFQVGAAIFRPAAPKKASIDELGIIRAADKPTLLRSVWSGSHRILGYVAVIVAIVNCYGGLDLLDLKVQWRTAFTGVIGILFVIFLLLQVVACLRSDSDVEEAGPSPRIQMSTVPVGSSIYLSAPTG